MSDAMQRSKGKWRADHGARAIKQLTSITASIARLDDEDLLDLQDIFANHTSSILKDLASVEVERRGLKY
jgi:hypothetical protein